MHNLIGLCVCVYIVIATNKSKNFMFTQNTRWVSSASEHLPESQKALVAYVTPPDSSAAFECLLPTAHVSPRRRVCSVLSCQKEEQNTNSTAIS